MFVVCRCYWPCFSFLVDCENIQIMKCVYNLVSFVNFVLSFLVQGGSRSGECVIDVDLSREQDEFLTGHAIDGRVLFPATGYLVSCSCINIFRIYGHSVFLLR